MKTRTFRSAAFLALCALLFAAAAQAQRCEPIRFQRGHDSGTVRGVAPPDDVVCYELATGAGQKANVKVTGQNVMFSIDGVIDGQDKYSFTTEKKTYRILVGQLMRAVSGAPFSLAVSVK